MSAGAAAAVVQRQRRNESSAGSGTRRIVEGREGVSAEEAAELAAIEEEAKGQVAERTMGVYEEKAQGKAGRITKKPSFIIDPRTNKYMGYWDGLSMVRLQCSSQAASVVQQAAVPAASARGRRAVRLAVHPAYLIVTQRRRRASTAHLPLHCRFVAHPSIRHSPTFVPRRTRVPSAAGACAKAAAHAARIPAMLFPPALTPPHLFSRLVRLCSLR